MADSRLHGTKVDQWLRKCMTIEVAGSIHWRHVIDVLAE